MASRSVNQVTLIGRLGRDAETSALQTGATITKLSVATDRRWKDKATDEWKEETNWTNVILWRGENVAPYLLKGTQVYVGGRLSTRSYDKDGVKVYVTEVVADEVILLGGKGAADGGKPRGDVDGAAMRSAPRTSEGLQPAAGSFLSAAVSDDDVPF